MEIGKIMGERGSVLHVVVYEVWILDGFMYFKYAFERHRPI